MLAEPNVLSHSSNPSAPFHPKITPTRHRRDRKKSDGPDRRGNGKLKNFASWATTDFRRCPFVELSTAGLAKDGVSSTRVLATCGAVKRDLSKGDQPLLFL